MSKKQAGKKTVTMTKQPKVFNRLARHLRKAIVTVEEMAKTDPAVVAKQAKLLREALKSLREIHTEARSDDPSVKKIAKRARATIHDLASHLPAVETV